MADARVVKIGNLTRDPELQFGKDSGKPFCRFSIATDRPKEPGNWAGEKVTEYYDVTAFETLALNAAESLTKGMRVVVVGRPNTREYEDKDGKTKTAKQILADGLGPDLRWATAVVTKAKATVKTAPNDENDSGDEDEF